MKKPPILSTPQQPTIIYVQQPTQKKRTSLFTWFVAIFLCVPLLIAVIAGSIQRSGEHVAPTPTPSASSDQELVRELCIQSDKAVKTQLKAPSTAKFPDVVWNANEWQVSRLKDGSGYIVISHVDSQNSFGALIRRVAWAQPIS